MFILSRKGLLKCDLYLQGVLYLEVAFNTGLTVDFYFRSNKFPGNKNGVMFIFITKN